MSTVRRHTRRTASGRTATVHQHRRKGERARRAKPKQRGGLQARRAFRNLGKAFKAARRSRKGRAAVYATLGVAELGAWVTLRGVALSLTTVALVAGALAFAAAGASGGLGGMSGARRPAKRRRSTARRGGQRRGRSR